jgi:hypothetical protein
MTVWERGIWEGFGCARKGRRWRGALMGFNGEGGRHLAGKEIGDEREREMTCGSGLEIQIPSKIKISFKLDLIQKGTSQAQKAWIKILGDMV